MNQKKNIRKYSKIMAVLLILSICFVGCYLAMKQVAAAEELELKVDAGNGWNDGRAEYQQLNCTITNTSNKKVSNWKVTMPFTKDTEINQGWQGTYTIDSAGVITVKPDSSNMEIAAGQSITFGFIVKNPGEFDVNSAIISTGESQSQETQAPQQSKDPGKTTEPETTATPEVTTKPVETKKPEQTVVPVETEKPQETNKPSQDQKKDWLYTDGSKIYDEDGKEVWLTGVNWFGYNTGTNIFDGVWACDLDKTIAEIANRGFNLLRIPISSELLLDWKAGTYPEPCYNDYVNPYLAGMNSLEIFDHVIQVCKENGIKIMMDIHCATNAAAHYHPVWFTDDFTEAQYLESLRWMANRYKNDDTIVAIDLKNEPHGKANDKVRAIWNDSEDPCNWKYIATKAANIVLGENPNLLIVVEGIEIYPKDLATNSDYHSTNSKEYYGTWWGGNLRGVKDYPIDLGKYQNKLVYSPHDYGPTVFLQDWFQGDFTMDSLYNDVWRDNWFYIQEENIAPLLIGEWGGFMTEPNLKWMTYLRDFIIKNRINHTFWCFNANSGDTGGLVLHDFTTWDEEKYAFVKEALWQKGGKFVGLDHDIPLGENGLTLSQY